jgi:hypothetical protein
MAIQIEIRGLSFSENLNLNLEVNVIAPAPATPRWAGRGKGKRRTYGTYVDRKNDSKTRSSSLQSRAWWISSISVGSEGESVVLYGISLEYLRLWLCVRVRG